MKPLIIFGAGRIAEVAHFYFRHDSPLQVAGFAVDGDYLDRDTFQDLPVVALDEVESRFPPSRHDMFIALSYTKVNKVRAEKYADLKGRGYSLASYVSSRATTWPDLRHGDNCFILEDNTIQPFVRIGNNVTLWSGNHVGHHCRIGDHCFISSHVVFSGNVEVGEKCFVGVNSTLRDGIKVADSVVLGARTYLSGDADEGSVYMEKPSERSRVPSHRLRNI